MKRRTSVCLAVLLGAAYPVGFAGAANGAKPEKLIKAILEMEDGLGVMPLQCLGADVVNLGGRGEILEIATRRITFDCLPGAVVCVIGKGFESDKGAFLVVTPEDDGKAIHLSFGTNSVRKNGALCTLKLPPPDDAKQLAEELDLLKQAKKGKQTGLLTVILKIDAASQAVIKELRGSGVGIVVENDPDAKTPSEAVFKDFVRAIAEAEPRLLQIDRRGFDQIGGRLSKLETLMLDKGLASDAAAADLSKLTSLRHLLIGAKKEKAAIDLKPLEKLTRLRALTIVAPGQDCKNIGATGSLTDLQFLTLIFKLPRDIPFFKDHPPLRYLAAAFPADVNFAFAEKIPYLQTLCILGVKEKHDLKPLEKLPNLRCLALSQHPRGVDENTRFDAKDFENVKEFANARSDVQVVEYRGVCLGSLWMLLLAAAAGVAAWVVRRRWIGHRAVWQR
jgi:hypothetical protein